MNILFDLPFLCSHPVNKLLQISNNVIASGDDQGCIKIWDTRQHNCIVEWKEHVDFISDMTLHPAGGHLVATGGDGRLSVYDLRKNVLAGKSDELDDELLSVSVIKNGKKIVCGSQDGVLVIFSWGTFGDMSDRFPGHPESVETVLKVDEDTILTGSSDGIIRVVQIHPNKLLGLIGDHEEFPVEVLKFSHNKRIIGSVSHVNKVHFWDVGYLYDEDEDEEQINEKDIPQLCMTSGREEKMEVDVSDSDDEDDSDDVSDDDDSEMMGNRGNSGGIHGRKTMPTEREAFFSDL
jgi:WD40 repeat protein